MVKSSKGVEAHPFVGSQGVISGLPRRTLPAVSTCTARAHTHTHKPQPHTSWLPRARALHFRGLQVTQLKQVARGNKVKFAPQSWIPNLLELGGVSGVGCLAQLPIWTGLPCKYPFTDLLRPSVCLHSSMDGGAHPQVMVE